MTDPMKKINGVNHAVQTLRRMQAPSLFDLTKKAAEAGIGTKLNFECSPEDMACIQMIVTRALEIGAMQKPKIVFDRMLASMDIANIHCNGYPMHLTRFLLSAPADFMRDFAGCGNHVNRAEGGIIGEWRPLCLRTKAA